jgi:hypothetical protein
MAINPTPETATFDDVQFPLSKYASKGLLATRDQAEEARSALQRTIPHLVENAPIGVDVRDIDAMSFPFADSFFGPLLSGWISGYYDTHPIVVTGANRDVRDTIDAVLRLLNMGIVCVGNEGSRELLGGEPSLRETINAAVRLGGKFSATEVGAALGVTPQAMNNRLKALMAMGAVRRVAVAVPGGGREFAYRVSEAPLGHG